MPESQEAFSPYVADINFNKTRFKFKIFSKEAKEQHDRQPGHPNYRKDIGVTFYGYEQFKFIQETMLEPGDVIIDAGAEYGFTTVLFSLLTGNSGRVLTIEAHPWMANCTSQNVKINSLQNVRVVNAAVGSVEGATINFAGSAVLPEGDGIKVKVTTLDQYAALFPDFVKIDIEGYEVEALKGAQRLLAQTPKLQIELHEPLLREYGASVEDFFRLIHCDRYRFFIQRGGDQSRVDPFDPAIEANTIQGVVQIFALPLDGMRKRPFLRNLRRSIRWMF